MSDRMEPVMGGINFGLTPDEREVRIEAVKDRIREAMAREAEAESSAAEAQTPAESGKEPLAECVADNLLDMLDIIDRKMTCAGDADDMEQLAEAARKIALTLHQCGLLEKEQGKQDAGGIG